MAVTENNILKNKAFEEYYNLKIQEYYEPNQERRKDVSKLVRKIEAAKNIPRSWNDDLNDMFENNSISNDETVEITGGRIK